MNDTAAAPANDRTNRPPLMTIEQLRVDFPQIEKGVSEYERKAADAPTVLEDDDDLGTITALVRLGRGVIKRVEEIRDENKRPFMEAGNLVYSFFKAYEARLDAAKIKLERTGEAYLRRKEQAELARREEERKKAEAEAHAKAEAAAAAEREKREAEEAAAAAKENAAAEDAATDDWIAKEAARQAAADASARRAAEADAAQKAAEQAASAAAVKPADMARTSTTSGTASLKQTWSFEILNIDMVDLNALRPYLATPDVERAIRGFIKAGRRELAGVRIYNSTKGTFG